MRLNADTVRLVQRALGFTGDDVDGIMGSETEKALDRFLQDRKDKLSPEHVAGILSGGRRRKATALGQLIAHQRNLDPGKVDGLLGPQTTFAFKQLIFLVKNGKMPPNWRDRPDTPNPHGWPNDTRSQQEVKAFYGKPGDSRLKKVELPYLHKISWLPSSKTRTTFCHELVADSLLRVLTKVVEEYQEEGIEELGLNVFGGCYNKRPKRGGTTWSMHSWGIALDYDPDNNRLHWGWDEARFAHPNYDKWWEFWEEEGWVSLGRSRNFDFMHIQAARV